MLDGQTLIQISDGDLATLTPGLLRDSPGRVGKKVNRNIEDPDQYKDLMVEFAFAGWHLSKGHSVELIQDEGMANQHIGLPGVDVPMFADCKRLLSSSADRLKQVIKKTSSQVRATVESRQIRDGEYFGVAALDITAITGLPVPITDPDKFGSIHTNDRIDATVATAEQALSGNQNRNVGAVVVMWDILGLFGEPPANVYFAAQRNFRILTHSTEHARSAIPVAAQVFEGSTIHLRVRHWVPR